MNVPEVNPEPFMVMTMKEMIAYIDRWPHRYNPRSKMDAALYIADMVQNEGYPDPLEER